MFHKKASIENNDYNLKIKFILLLLQLYYLNFGRLANMCVLPFCRNMLPKRPMIFFLDFFFLQVTPDLPEVQKLHRKNMRS